MNSYPRIAKLGSKDDEMVFKCTDLVLRLYYDLLWFCWNKKALSWKIWILTIILNDLRKALLI